MYCRNAHHDAPGRLVNISLDCRKPGRSKIMLAVSVVAVIGLSGQPARQVVPISYEESACVSGTLSCPLPRGVFGEETRTLQADLRTGFLRYCCGSQEKSKACKHDHYLPHV